MPSSYNRLNDTYSCENDVTLNKELKDYMGFRGFVMSDWGGTHSTTQAADSGLDQEMPSGNFFGQVGSYPDLIRMGFGRNFVLLFRVFQLWSITP